MSEPMSVLNKYRAQMQARREAAGGPLTEATLIEKFGAEGSADLLALVADAEDDVPIDIRLHQVELSMLGLACPCPRHRAIDAKLAELGFTPPAPIEADGDAAGDAAIDAMAADDAGLARLAAAILGMDGGGAVTATRIQGNIPIDVNVIGEVAQGSWSAAYAIAGGMLSQMPNRILLALTRLIVLSGDAMREAEDVGPDGAPPYVALFFLHPDVQRPDSPGWIVEPTAIALPAATPDGRRAALAAAAAELARWDGGSAERLVPYEGLFPEAHYGPDARNLIEPGVVPAEPARGVDGGEGPTFTDADAATWAAFAVRAWAIYSRIGLSIAEPAEVIALGGEARKALAAFAVERGWTDAPAAALVDAAIDAFADEA